MIMMAMVTMSKMKIMEVVIEYKKMIIQLLILLFLLLSLWHLKQMGKIIIITHW